MVFFDTIRSDRPRAATPSHAALPPRATRARPTDEERANPPAHHRSNPGARPAIYTALLGGHPPR